MIRRSLCIAAFLTATAFCGSATPATAALRYGPYLQSMAPDTVRVCAAVEPGDELRIRIEGGEGSREAGATGAAPACAEFAGLLPDIAYRYALVLNGRMVSTDPLPSFVASSTEGAVLVIFGDTRSGDDSFDLAHRRIVKTIQETTVPDAILHTGDFVEYGDRPALWDNYFRIEEELLATAPLFPAVGQSDQPADAMRHLFPVLGPAPWYSFDRAQVHVAVLDLWQSDSQPPAEVSADGEQVRWLRADLARTRTAGAKYVFVVMHEPVVDVDGTIPRAVRETFLPIFEAFGVAAVFSGAHYFSHAVVGGVHYFTNGGGGALLETREPAPGVFLFYQAVHHFLVLDVDAAGARLTAVNAEGTEFYSARFDEAPGGTRADAAPTFVESYPGGAPTAPVTVFFQEGCDDCERLQALLPEIAEGSGATLVATYRSIDDPDNRALFDELAGPDAPTPAVSVGESVLVGLDRIESELAARVADAVEIRAAAGTGSGRMAFALLAVVAGIGLLAVVLIALRSNRPPREGRRR